MRSLALALLALLVACSSARTYTLVFLKTGSREGLSDEDLGVAMQGHFDNMGRMIDDGQLYLAGPFVDPRSDPGHRGLFLFSTASHDEASAWAASDPAVKAGVFTAHVDTWWSDDPVEQIRVLEKEDEVRRLADPDLPDDWSGRFYVVVTGSPVAAARKALAQVGDAVVLSGTLSKDGEFAWLDVTSLEEAQALLADGEVTWAWHPWYGSKMLPQLAQ